MSSNVDWLLDCRVKHPYFGAGRIIKSRYGGLHCLVQFHNGAKLWLRRIDLQILDPPATAEPQHEPQVPFEAVDRVQALQMFEALKFGIVPYDAITYFTIGRKEQIALIQSTLDAVAKGGSALVIEGPYGSGKSHLSGYIHHLALQAGFASAHVELDPFEVTPYKPKRIYRALLETLEWPKPTGGIGNWNDLFNGVIAGEISLPEDHPYFRPAMKALARIRNDMALAHVIKAWLAGEMLDRWALRHHHLQDLPILYDHSTAADHLANLLSGWSIVLHDCGTKGLVLVFDEGETVFHARARLVRQRGFNTIRGLVKVAMNHPSMKELRDLRRDPHVMAYLDRSGFVHSGLRPLPYAYRLPSYLGVFITVTPTTHPWYKEMQGWFPESRKTILWPFIPRDYAAMCTYIFNLHHQLYPDLPYQSKDAQSAFDLLQRQLWIGDDAPNPRLFLKALSEILALRRAYPNRSIDQITTTEAHGAQLFRIK